MTSPHTLENCLILACARTNPDARRIQDLVERGPDWQAIQRKAERWGLAPLVHTNLRQAASSGQVPEPTAEGLRHLYHRNTIHGAVRRDLPRTILLHLALHLAHASGFVGHVRTLCDIGEMCRRYGSAIDWSRLVTQAETYGVGKQLYYPLCLARDLVGAGVPSPTLIELRASFGQL